MHRNLDRFRPHEGVIPYSCLDAITILRKSLKDVVDYKNVGLSKSLGFLVLQLELDSAFLTVFLLRCVLVYPLPLTVFFSSTLFTWSLFCYSSCLVLRLCRRLL